MDHVEEVRSGAHPAWESSVEEILKIASEIEELLISKAGLFVAFPPPESFEEFIAHSRRLQSYWDRKENQPPEQRLPFSREFDEDVLAGINQIRTRLSQLERRAH